MTPLTGGTPSSLMNSVDILLGGYLDRFHLDGYVILGKVIVSIQAQNIVTMTFRIVIRGLCPSTSSRFPLCSTLNSVSWKVYPNV